MILHLLDAVVSVLTGGIRMPFVTRRGPVEGDPLDHPDRRVVQRPLEDGPFDDEEPFEPRSADVSCRHCQAPIEHPFSSELEGCCLVCQAELLWIPKSDREGTS